MSAPAPSVTIVIPMFNEAVVLPELFQRLTAMLNHEPGVQWEVLLVDDGSQDASAALVMERSRIDARFRLLQLSRNFGFQAALAAGISHATGDAVVTMDADLQDPPEVIPELVARWRDGADVVRATRRSRQETGLRRLGMNAFHALFGSISDFPIAADAGTFGLMSRAAVDALNQLPERHRYFPGLRAWVGFTTAEVMYDRHERAAGRPQQTLRRLARYAFDGVFSFSYLPLRALTYAGLLISGAGFSLGVFFIAKRLLGLEVAQTGFTTLVTLVLFLGGIQLIGIGVLGEYLARVYDEVKRRPLYLTRQSRDPQR